MTFNLHLQNQCRRKDNMRDAAAETFRSILEPFRLHRLYPPVEAEIAPGVWKSTYNIQPHQRKMHDGVAPSGRKAKFTCFSGGVGSGKTRAVCAEMVKLLRTYPGVRIVCVSGYDYYFDEFLMPTWHQVLPEDSPHVKSYNKKNRSIVLTNGSSIRFKAYDDPEKVKGWEAHVIWIEEASELGDGNNDKAMMIWQALLMRLRASRPPYPLRVYVTQNPKGHNWVWKVFIKSEPQAPQPLGDIGKKTVFGTDADGADRYFKEWEKVLPNGDVLYTIATGTNANAHIPPGYISSMLGQMVDSPGLKQRMVEGEFNPINSLVYDFPIYAERTHLIDYNRFLDYWEYDSLPSWNRVVFGIDCGGQRSPWAVQAYMQTEDGHWIGFDEFYRAGLTWGEVADEIKRMAEPFENVAYWIDPISSSQKSGPTSDTIAEEFQRRGIAVQKPRGYNKTGGIMRVQSLLRRDPQQPCPYIDDTQIESEDGSVAWDVGHAQLYYLTKVPWKMTASNPEGHAMPGNVAEKRVYRYDNTKHREAKAAEEGLSPVISEKLIDRDDHAQTGEMFFALGINPLVKKNASDRSNRPATLHEHIPVQYGRSGKHRRVT